MQAIESSQTISSLALSGGENPVSLGLRFTLLKLMPFISLRRAKSPMIQSNRRKTKGRTLYLCQEKITTGWTRACEKLGLIETAMQTFFFVTWCTSKTKGSLLNRLN